MTCFLCKGDMAADLGTYVETLDKGVIVVRNVPCMKCAQCGEVAYNGETVRRLEQLLEDLRSAMPEVAVIEYQSAA